MIIPLGPQNAFVIAQGIRRQYYLMVATICAMSDIILICLGIFGGSVLLNQSPLLLQLVTWGGVTFLLWYGWRALKAACQATEASADLPSIQDSPWRIMLIVLAVTWLNPHVYLDTVVVLGSIGGQMSAEQRPWFALGTISASLIWFFTIAILAARLAPWLQKPSAQRIINLLVGVIMWIIAWQLASQALMG